MVPLGFFFLFFLEILDHAKLLSLVQLPTTLDQEGEKPSEYCNSTMPMAGIEPGPPAQQARALSITPLPPG